MTIPDPEPIALPGPIPLLRFLLVLGWLLHSFPMNLILGGNLLLLITHWKAFRGSTFHQELAEVLRPLLPIATAFTVTFGIVPLLFVQVLYGQAFFTSSILISWPWYLLWVIVLLAYLGMYAQPRGTTNKKHLILSGLISLLLMWTAFMFTNNVTLMMTPAQWENIHQTRGIFYFNLAEPTLWPRFLHILVATIATSGAFLALFAGLRQWLEERSGSSANQQRWRQVARWGLRWLAGALFLEFILGPLFMLYIPGPLRSQFLGGDRNLTGALGLAVLLALITFLVALLSQRSDHPWRGGWIGFLLLIPVVADMAWNREALRQLHLQSYIFVEEQPVQPHFLLIGIFFALLLLGLGIVGWLAGVTIKYKKLSAEQRRLS